MEGLKKDYEDMECSVSFGLPNFDGESPNSNGGALMGSKL